MKCVIMILILCYPFFECQSQKSTISMREGWHWKLCGSEDITFKNYITNGNQMLPFLDEQIPESNSQIPRNDRQISEPTLKYIAKSFDSLVTQKGEKGYHIDYPAFVYWDSVCRIMVIDKKEILFDGEKVIAYQFMIGRYEDELNENISWYAIYTEKYGLTSAYQAYGNDPDEIGVYELVNRDGIDDQTIRKLNRVIRRFFVKLSCWP